MDEPKTYELTTIRDIFEKVPADRIKLCCEELGTLLSVNKETVALLEMIGEDIGCPMPFKFGDTLKWIDDGKGELNAKYSAGGEPLLTVAVNRKASK
jgi:hypothetical protein